MRLQEKFTKEIAPRLQKELGLKNVMAIPRVSHMVLNVGLSKGLKDAKFLETVEQTLVRITGQRPVKTKSRKSIATFHIREGMVIGMKVTLRGRRMWDFLEKLIMVSLPRVRDFRGLSPKAFDANGNYSLGFQEHIAFPEIRSDEIEVLHGLQVTMATTAKNSIQGLALLKALGFPMKQ